MKSNALLVLTHFRFSRPPRKKSFAFFFATLLCLAFSSRASAQILLPSIEPPPEATLTGDASSTATVADASSQNPPDGSAAPQAPSVSPAGRKRCGITALPQCGKDFLQDQKGIWLTPFHMHGEHLTWWLLGFGGATAAAIATDKQALATLGHPNSFVTGTRYFSDIGSPYSVAGISAGFYFIGAAVHNDRARESGVLGIEAMVDAELLGEVIKLASNRDRPDQGNGEGEFWGHGLTGYPHTSFPSGHVLASWSLAAVLAEEYPTTPVRILVYGLATAVAATRVTGRQHFPSDVLVGGVLGYLTGRYVVRHHSAQRQGAHVFEIRPYSSPYFGGYGVAVGISPQNLHPRAFADLFH